MTVRVPSLRRSFSWTILGNAMFAACLWGILVVLTKLGSTDIVGRFALGSAIASPVFMFANLQLRAVQSTDAAGTYEFRDYLGVRLLMLPAALVVVLVVAYLGYSREQFLVIGIFALVRFVEALSDLFYGFAQKSERMDLVARSLWLRGGGALVLFGVTFFFTRNLALSLLAQAVSWGLVVLLFDWPQLRILAADAGESSVRPRWNRKVVRDIVWMSLPLGFVMLLVTLRNTIPRTFLEKAFGEEELGIFSALSYLVIAGSTVILALSQSSLARLSRYFAEGRRDALRSTIQKILGVGLVIGVVGVLVAAVIGKPVLSVIYSPEYAEHNRLFVLIMIAGGVTYVGSLMGSPILAMRNFRDLLWVYLGNTFCILSLAWYLIPRYGMMGAAWAMLGGAVWTLLGNGFLIVRGISRMEEAEVSSPETGA